MNQQAVVKSSVDVTMTGIVKYFKKKTKSKKGFEGNETKKKELMSLVLSFVLYID